MCDCQVHSRHKGRFTGSINGKREANERRINARCKSLVGGIVGGIEGD